MASWFDELSTRSRASLLGLLMLLPVLAILIGLLAARVHDARASAHDKVRVLAVGTAAAVQRTLDQSETILGRLARRPQILALDPQACGNSVAEVAPLNPAYLNVDVRVSRGHLVCSYLPSEARSMTADEARWFSEALGRDQFMASDVAVDPATGKRVVVLSHPVRDGNGVAIGLVTFSVDLLTLNTQLLAETPANALLTVVDRSRSVAFRSTEPDRYIGTRLGPDAPHPPAAGGEGTFETHGRDGAPWLFAVATVPASDWQVFAGLPRAVAFAEYEAALRTAIVIAGGTLVLAATMAWRLGASVAGPIAKLRRSAARMAAGEESLRAEVSGPPDIRSLAAQLNQLLETKAVNEARQRGILETAVDAILVVNDQRIIVQANPAGAHAFQCPADEMVGSPLERFIPHRFREQHRADLEAFGTGTTVARHMGNTREVMALRSDGHEFPIEASISHMSVGGQRLYTVMLRDVTERSTAQRELAAGKSKLEVALSSMTDAVLITDGNGDPEQFNEAFARFHRFKDMASCRRPLNEFSALVDMRTPGGAPVPLAQWPVLRALRGESASNAEYQLRRSDTGESWLGDFGYAPIRSTDGVITGSVMVARDITAARLAQADVQLSHAVLQRLIANQDRVQHDERSRIARELHDDLQQTLAAIRIDISQLGERLARSAIDQTSLLSEIEALSAQAIASTRRIVDDLRPQILEDLGIVPSLQALVDQFRVRTSVASTLQADDGIGEILGGAPELADCLFRVAQEGLNNVAKHARASHVQVRLAKVSPTRVSLSVVDDGLGIRPRDRRNKESFGIIGMQERARAQGGTLRVDRLAAGGTVLEILLPLGAAEDAPDTTTDSATASQGIDSSFGAFFRESSGTKLAEVLLPQLLSVSAERAVQGVIDAMPGSVAVLDGRGIVRLVNRGWIEFAERNGCVGAVGMGPGVDYLEICRIAALSDETVRPVFLGLTELIEGRASSFDIEYPCHSPEQMRWFRMSASPMRSGDVLVTHSLVTRQQARVPSMASR